MSLVIAPDGALSPVARFYEWECARLLHEQRRDVCWYRRLAEELGGPILELACGAGRVAITLAESGWDVVGLDIQAHLVGCARANAERRGSAARTSFRVGDMRSFTLGRRFPLVLLPYNTLGYLLRAEEVVACFRGVEAHLAPGGVFAFQVRSFEAGEPSQPRGFVARGPYEDGVLEMYEAVTVEAHTHISHYDEEYRLRRSGGPVVVFRERLTLRSFYRDEVEHLLAASGLRVRALYHDFDLRPRSRSQRPDGPMLFEAVRGGEL